MDRRIFVSGFLGLAACGGEGSSSGPLVVVPPEPTPSPSPSPSTSPSPSPGPARAEFQIDVNISGYEYGSGSSSEKLFTNYVTPSLTTLRYLQAKGFKRVRFPMKWERLQPQLDGPIDSTQIGYIEQTLADAASCGISIIADLHNYGRYKGQALGNGILTSANFANFWRRFADQFQGRFFGYSLMNEPHDMPSKTAWPDAAQAAVDAIREVDAASIILCCGDGWSGAASWQSLNASLNVRDPVNRLWYEAHLYFDSDASGTYQQSYTASGATPQTGAARLKPFTDWLAARGAKGYIGECGWPDSDPAWNTVGANLLTAAKAAGIPVAYWLAGDWSANDPNSIQPKSAAGPDRAQLAVLTAAI